MALGFDDLLDFGVVLHETDSRISYANEAACRMLGLTREELLLRSSQSPAWDLCSSDGHALTPAEHPAMRALASGEPCRGVVVGVLLPDLTQRSWLRVDAVPVTQGVLVTFTDVTREHKGVREAERARAESEQRHAAVLRAMSEGVVVHDATGAIVFSNPAAERILGLSADQMRGLEAVDPRWRLVRPDTGAALAPSEIPSEVTRLTGKPCRDVTLGVHRANDERAWLSVSTDAVEPLDGAGQYVVATFTDITSERDATIALERANARFSAVTSAFPGVLFQALRDAGGRLELVFVAGETGALVGLSPDDMMAPSFDVRSLIEPDDLASTLKTLSGANDQPVLHAEVRVRKGEEWRWARLRATPAPTDRGVLLTGVALDITEERRFAAGLERAQRREAMGDLAAGMAHNFNNVLAAVLPNLDEARVHVAPEGRPLVDAAVAATERAADLVRELMRLARGDSDTEKQPVDVTSIVTEVSGLCRRTFGRRIQVDLEIRTEGPVTTSGHPSQLHQALLNLCLNARDALEGRRDPRLCVRLERERADRLVLTVRDTGAGMDEATLRRIGEPFFTTKAPGRGTGLGVASAMRVAREMGGELSVESKVGEGTTFRLELPCLEAGPVAKRAPDAPGEGAIGSLLFVEDEALVRTAIARSLQRHVSRIVIADGGQQALDKLDRDQAFDVVLLDLSMPGLSGRATLDAIHTRLPHLPVVVMSGDVGDRSGLGTAAAILEKPIPPGQLVKVLHQVVERARHR